MVTERLEYTVETNGFHEFVQKEEGIKEVIHFPKLEDVGLRFKKTEVGEKSFAENPKASVRKVKNVNVLISIKDVLFHAQKYLKIQNRCISVREGVLDAGFESARSCYTFTFSTE